MIFLIALDDFILDYMDSYGALMLIIFYAG